MQNRHARPTLVCAAMVVALGAVSTPSAQSRRQPPRLAGAALQRLRELDAQTSSMLRSGELRVRRTDQDTLIPQQVTERDDQYYKGVRVFGGDVTRHMDAQGMLLSGFGTIYLPIDVPVDPSVTSDAARATVIALAGGDQGPDRQPELVIVPLGSGNTPSIAASTAQSPHYHLAWRMRAVTAHADIVQYFVDAMTGDVLLQYSDRRSQSAIGTALGVLGDTKKISVAGTPGNYVARDLLRPALVQTEDLKGDPIRTNAYLSGLISLTGSDTAANTTMNNSWTDVGVDDAHVYAGYTYDFYFKQFGRHGIDDSNRSIFILGNPVRREDVNTYFSSFSDFFTNAFYAGNGIVLFGVGLPPGFTLGGQTWTYTAGALEIVAHEITHGVTQYTSNLIYLDESGALDEGFSDIMGSSTEFFYEPPGDGPQQADYELGKDVVRPGGIRSMDNPALHGDPDNYSKRSRDPDDNGGVHTNACIADQAYYLAIEGGTNRTSGLSVQGVGAANRVEIEKAFYRGFTQLLPSNATFSVARAATIQAARDLYGDGSAPEQAITQAWTAVGVQ
ncbi:MAG TPA: M4 family metallopeptidase [Vicinamibacterales bacterium]